MSETRFCQYCNTDHPLLQEYWRKSGQSFTCKIKAREVMQLWRKNNPERQKEILKKCYEKRKASNPNLFKEEYQKNKEERKVHIQQEKLYILIKA